MARKRRKTRKTRKPAKGGTAASLKALKKELSKAIVTIRKAKSAIKK